MPRGIPGSGAAAGKKAPAKASSAKGGVMIGKTTGGAKAATSKRTATAATKRATATKRAAPKATGRARTTSK